MLEALVIDVPRERLPMYLACPVCESSSDRNLSWQGLPASGPVKCRQCSVVVPAGELKWKHRLCFKARSAFDPHSNCHASLHAMHAHETMSLVVRCTVLLHDWPHSDPTLLQVTSGHLAGHDPTSSQWVTVFGQAAQAIIGSTPGNCDLMSAHMCTPTHLPHALYPPPPSNQRAAIELAHPVCAICSHPSTFVAQSFGHVQPPSFRCSMPSQRRDRRLLDWTHKRLPTEVTISFPTTR